MKLFRLVMLIATALALLLNGTVVAAPDAPEGINTFTVSPNPQFKGQDVTVSLNVTMNATPGATGFCLYSPTAISVTLPTTITLNQAPPAGGPRAFTSQDNTPCDDSLAETVDWHYLPVTATVTNRTFSGSFVVNLPATAPSGSHTWALFLESTNSGQDYMSYTHQITDPPSAIYASDQANCGGYGLAGTSCFQSLKAAYDRAVAYTANELVVVGDLTVNPNTEAIITSTLTLIREINSGRLVAGSSCTTNTLLTAAKNNLTVRGLTLDGASCSGAATGIRVDTGADNITLDNVTVKNFSAGTGIAFTGTGAGTLRNSKGSVTGNAIGIDDASSGAVNIGTSPADGNTITNNTRGIRTNGAIVIKGNDISGGVYGVELTGVPTALYGNRVIGASTQQIFCNGATNGAAWNFLGGTSPASGSNCSDVDSQLGSNFVSWADGGVVSGLSVSGSVLATFDLGNNLPFAYGSTTGRTSNYYAIYTNDGSATVTVGGTGTKQYKMFVPPNTGNACPTGTEGTCWDSTLAGRAQTGSGYYYKGSLDPTAITLRAFMGASSTGDPNVWLLVALAAIGLLITGSILRLRHAVD